MNLTRWGKKIKAKASKLRPISICLKLTWLATRMIAQTSAAMIAIPPAPSRGRARPLPILALSTKAERPEARGDIKFQAHVSQQKFQTLSTERLEFISHHITCQTGRATKKAIFRRVVAYGAAKGLPTLSHCSSRSFKGTIIE